MKISLIQINIFLLFAFVQMGCGEIPENHRNAEVLPYYQEATFMPHWLEPDSEKAKAFHKVSEFSLFNQDGELITEKEVDGKIYITDFFFTTCPGICPRMTENMSVLQEEFLKDEDVLLLSHSVTPARDSIKVLQAYAEKKGVVSGKWHLLTGERSEIYRLGRKDYFVEENLGLEKDEDEFLHTENFVLIDKNRHIRGIYNGLNKTSISELIKDIKTLKQEG